MSDQHKPTLAKRLGLEPLPKPTTGEHKAGCPALGGYGHGPEPCICGAGKPKTGEWTAESVMNFFTSGTHYESCEACAKAINAALAAERKERVTNLSSLAEGYRLEVRQLRSQQRPLVDELKRMSFSYLATADELRQMARDALAKVKEGK